MAAALNAGKKLSGWVMVKHSLKCIKYSSPAGHMGS